MMRVHIATGLLVSAILFLSSCGGGGGGGPSAPPIQYQPPVASESNNVLSGVAPLTVMFDGSSSSDPQGLALTYTWNFGDGSSNGSGVSVTHVFQNHGSYLVTLTVSDGHNTASRTASITVSPAPPSVQPLTLLANILGTSPSTVTGTVVATDREGLALGYSITSAPSVGTATINAQTGAVTYSVQGFTPSGTTNDQLTVSVANLGASASMTVVVNLNADPLLPNQWQLQNTGQSAFATTLPVAGNDENVAGAWAAGYSGKGIKVGVADTGIEAAHEDLAANVDVPHSWNFLTLANDPTPGVAGEDHGTMVSGIIGAVAFNGKGGRGVAYNATLRGYNLIAPNAGTIANFATALGDATISADNDLFNASFGPVTNAIPTFSGAFQTVTSNSMTLRGGLGATIVNAAGNDFADFEGASSPLCGTARLYGVSCGDTATDERRGGYVPLIVAALDATGTHASYSSTGSSIWISAYGGEYGLDQSTLPTSVTSQISNPDAYWPAIVTTAHSGCGNAPNPFSGAPINLAAPIALNPLDDLGANPLAANCQYTATMNGTSAATPNVTGVVALMLEANPLLSTRDIKYILAKTARRVDANFAGVSSATILPGSSVVLEQGWTTNAAGYAFSNRYGFGGIDASAAVAMAKSYSSYLPAIQNSTGSYSFVAAAPATIPPASTTGGYINFTVSEAFATVEFAIVYVNIASTPGLPCNQIELSSPSGTKSILMHAANGFTNVSIVNSRFESNAFYGEPINGTWVLRFLDFCPASGVSTALSTSQPQLLLFSGH